MNNDCQQCKFLMGYCFKHRPKETPEKRAERKAMYLGVQVARKCKGLDSEERAVVMKEAELEFERVNNNQ